MKRIICFLLCGLFVLTFASCGQKIPPLVAGEAFGEEETVPIDLSLEITADTTLPSEDVSCEKLEKNGKLSGFEMRFHKTPTLDEMFSNPENYYFAILECGKKQTVVPTEEIRLLADIETGEFAVTILLPSGQKLSGSECLVSLYVSAHSDSAEHALFSAEKRVSIG